MPRRSGRTTPNAVPRGDSSHLYVAHDTKSKRSASNGSQPTACEASMYVRQPWRAAADASPIEPAGHQPAIRRLHGADRDDVDPGTDRVHEAGERHDPHPHAAIGVDHEREEHRREVFLGGEYT